MQATIDIGTNSVLLLIGEAEQSGSVRPVVDEARVTRLGEGLADSGSISDKAAERTMAAIEDYLELCDRHSVSGIAAVGTAALRRASNAKDFLLIAERMLGLRIEVISAEREAELTYLASAHDFGEGIVVIDIGGGSTEIISSPSGSRRFVSMPIGCVNLTERFLKKDPPASEEIDSMRRHVRETLDEMAEPAAYARAHEAKLIATAGTATTLMAINLGLEPYRPDGAHGRGLRITELRAIIDELKSRTVEERKRIKGLIPERADVILAGAELLHETMEKLGYAEVTVSDRGVKWGLFYEKFGTSPPP